VQSSPVEGGFHMGSEHNVSTLLLVLGVVSLAVGLLLLWLRARKVAETNVVRSVAVGTAAEAACAKPGTQVAVEGTIRCDAPLIGEFSEKPCVYFSAKVEDSWDEDSKNSEGERTTESKSTVVSSTTRHTPFLLEDASGSVRVLPDSASIHAPLTFERKERNPGGLGWRTNLVRSYEEWALATDTALYVLGVVRADGAIGHTAKHVFLLDHRSGQERLDANLSALWWYALFSAAFLVIGVGLLGYGVASR
jgi:hypothetical protein